MAVAVNSAARVCTAPNGCGVALAGPLSGVRVGLRVANGVAVSTPVTVGVMVAVGVLVGVLVAVAGKGEAVREGVGDGVGPANRFNPSASDAADRNTQFDHDGMSASIDWAMRRV